MKTCIRSSQYTPSHFLFLFTLLIGLLSGCSSQREDKIRIGVSLPMDYESYGVLPYNGMKLALGEIDSMIHGKKVKLELRDDKALPQTGVATMNEFSSMGIPVVIGSAASTVSLAMVPIANRDSIVLVSPMSSAEELTQEGGRYFFRTVPTDPKQTETIVAWMMESSPTTVGILYVDNSWGRGLADAAEKHFQQRGVRVVRLLVTSEEVTDFSEEIKSLKRSSIKALFAPLYPRQAGLAVKQCREMRLEVPIFGADSWGSEEFLAGAGEYAEGAMFCVPGLYSGKDYVRFVESYKKNFGTEPNFNAASSYDCMHIVAQAIDSLITKGLAVTGTNLEKQMRKAKFIGATGFTMFDEHGDPVGKTYVRKVIRNGGFDFFLQANQ